MAKHKVMTIHLDFTDFEDNKVQKELGTAYKPNHTFSLTQYFDRGYEMSKIRVKHDEGHYLLAM